MIERMENIPQNYKENHEKKKMKVIKREREI